MGLLTKTKCENCSKEIKGDHTERLGKHFCNDKCMKEYGKKNPPKNSNVCEFC